MSRMRTLFIGLVGLLLLACVPAHAGPQDWRELLDDASDALSGDSQAADGQLADSDIAAGLKEALARGTTKAVEDLGRKGGFWHNELVRIALPDGVRDVAELARKLGQGDKVDAFQHSMNRAAEKAVAQVADIFGEAIREMSLKDARAILAGGDHAATKYFRRVAGDELVHRIKPIVSRATDSVGVTKRYKALTANLGGGELGGVLGLLGVQSEASSLDLDTYVTEQAIDGLFTEIAAQEQAIRENPAARTTALLKKVFGAG